MTEDMKDYLDTQHKDGGITFQQDERHVFHQYSKTLTLICGFKKKR